jgi:proteasome lid subunit RPN8/RPN11
MKFLHNMSATIQFSGQVLKEIQAHLLSVYPEEGCGFFAGIEGEPRVVKAWFPVRNMQEDARERRFQIAPIDYLKAEQWADNQGLALLGIYHSHPDHPAYPSETDLENAVPYFSYLIVNTSAFGAGASTSWQLDESGKFVEESVVALAATVYAAP